MLLEFIGGITWSIIFLLDIVFRFFLVYLFFKMKSSMHFKTLNLYGKLKEDSIWSSKLLPLRISIMRQQVYYRENFRNTVISGIIVHRVFFIKIENVIIWFNRIDKLMWNWNHYCVSHKYFFIKIDHSLRDLVRIKKEKNWKKLQNMKIVFIYFPLHSLIYHRNLSTGVCIYKHTCVYTHMHVVCWAGSLVSTPGNPTSAETSFSHWCGLNTHLPLLWLRLFQLDFCVLMSWLVNFVISWFFSIWAMGIYFLIFLSGWECLSFALSLKVELGWT